jgi:hypothetical protein
MDINQSVETRIVVNPPQRFINQRFLELDGTTNSIEDNNVAVETVQAWSSLMREHIIAKFEKTGKFPSTRTIDPTKTIETTDVEVIENLNVMSPRETTLYFNDLLNYNNLDENLYKLISIASPNNRRDISKIIENFIESSEFPIELFYSVSNITIYYLTNIDEISEVQTSTILQGFGDALRRFNTNSFEVSRENFVPILQISLPSTVEFEELNADVTNKHMQEVEEACNKARKEIEKEDDYAKKALNSLRTKKILIYGTSLAIGSIFTAYGIPYLNSVIRTALTESFFNDASNSRSTNNNPLRLRDLLDKGILKLYNKF